MRRICGVAAAAIDAVAVVDRQFFFARSVRVSERVNESTTQLKKKKKKNGTHKWFWCSKLCDDDAAAAMMTMPMDDRT